MKQLAIFLTEQGINQTQLAERMEFANSYISMILSGQRAPSDSFRWRFLQAFGPEATAQVFGNGTNHDS